MSMWIKPVSGTGTLFSKQDDSSFEVMYSLGLSSYTLQLEIKTFDVLVYYDSVHSCVNPIDSSSWHSVGVTLQVDLANDHTYYICYIDDTTESPVLLDSTYYQDLSTNFLMMIGGKFTTASTYTSLYTGFIFSVRVWNEDLDPIALDRQTGGCTGT